MKKLNNIENKKTLVPSEVLRPVLFSDNTIARSTSLDSNESNLFDKEELENIVDFAVILKEAFIHVRDTDSNYKTYIKING